MDTGLNLFSRLRHTNFIKTKKSNKSISSLLVLMLLFSALPLQAANYNYPLIAQRGYDWEEEEELETRKISTDVNIKGIDPKNLLFNTPISTTKSPLTKVLYDRATEGDGCVITCNFYNGVTSKWSDFFVDLQPFENFCLVLTGCSSQYPTPSDRIVMKVGELNYTLEMVDLSRNRYYLPLTARKAIASSGGNIVLEIRGVKMPSYKIGPNSRQALRKVVNQENELAEFISEDNSKTLEQKLVEAQKLLDTGLVSEEEYKALRKKILSQ